MPVQIHHASYHTTIRLNSLITYHLLPFTYHLLPITHLPNYSYVPHDAGRSVEHDEVDVEGERVLLLHYGGTRRRGACAGDEGVRAGAGPDALVGEIGRGACG